MKAKEAKILKLNSLALSHNAILILVLSVLLAFSNTLKNGFVYDDLDFIVHNSLIRTFKNLSTLLTRDYFYYTPEYSYRPLVTLSHFVDYYFFRLNPGGYHLINLLLHLTNALLVFILIKKLLAVFNGGTVKVINVSALFGAWFFAIHPVVTEPVNLPSYREDLLCTLFAVISLLLYLGWRVSSEKSSFLYLLLAGMTFFLSLLAKEASITLPLIILLFELSLPSMPLKRRLILFSPFILIVGFYLIIRFVIFVPPQKYFVGYFGGSQAVAVLNFPRFFVHYLFLIFYPVTLAADYNFQPLKIIIHPFILGSISCVIVYLLLALTAWRKRNFLISAGLLWFVVFLLPVSNLVPLSNPVAERYLYLPLIGLAIVLASIMKRIFLAVIEKKENVLFYKLIVGLVLVLFVLYIILDIQRNTMWRDDFTLWQETLRSQPRSHAALRGLGLIYLQRKNYTKAEEMLNAAVNLRPWDIKVRNNRAVLYAKKGELLRAIAELELITQMASKYAAARYNLARCYAALNPPQIDRAIEEAQKASELGYNVPAEFLNHLSELKSLNQSEKMKSQEP